MARPRIDPSLIRRQYQIRLTHAEKELLARAANREGMPMAIWLRTIALGAARRRLAGELAA